MIVVNSANAIYLPGTSSSNLRSMTDSRYNTYYIIWNKLDHTNQEMHNFRSCMAINLANPPPGFFLILKNALKNLISIKIDPSYKICLKQRIKNFFLFII